MNKTKLPIPKHLQGIFVPMGGKNNENHVDGESVVVRAADWKREVYLTQLPAYYAVKAALYDAFRSGDVTNEMYRDLIGFSSIWSVICSAKEQGADITRPGCKISLAYGFDDDYVLR